MDGGGVPGGSGVVPEPFVPGVVFEEEEAEAADGSWTGPEPGLLALL